MKNLNLSLSNTQNSTNIHSTAASDRYGEEAIRVLENTEKILKYLFLELPQEELEELISTIGNNWKLDKIFTRLMQCRLKNNATKQQMEKYLDNRIPEIIAALRREDSSPFSLISCECLE